MHHLCAQCGAVFSEKEALCEDWQDPDRSFICPLCHTCLSRGERPPRTLRQLLAAIDHRLVMAALVVLIGLVLVVRNTNLPAAFPVVTALLLAFGILVQGWFRAERPAPTRVIKPVAGHRVEPTAKVVDLATYRRDHKLTPPRRRDNSGDHPNSH